MKRALAAVAAAALVAPASASAHATLVRTVPANGAVVVRAPRTVTVLFDDVVTVGNKNAAVANATRRSILAGRVRAHGRTLTIPLRPQLPDGDYSVRWSIVSEDGHPEVGTIAFAVGVGGPPPVSILTANAPLFAMSVVLRTLWYGGLLIAAGAAALALLAGRSAGRWRAPTAHLLFFALLAAFIGAGGLAHGAPSGTRFAIALDAAAVAALLGATAAALAPGSPTLLRIAQVCALGLLAAPTFAGHALDRGQPALVAPLVDVAHLASAAVWLGGLVWLLLVVPRAASDELDRLAAARRFSSTALVAVALLGATGVGRALTEVSAVGQLVHTSYGRALLVKTAIFVPLLGVGWLNRRELAGGLVRLRTNVRFEIAALLGIVVAVAFLTQLRPARDAPLAAAAAATATPVGEPPALPPRNAVVAAGELGTLAVAVARTPTAAIVTVIDADATGLDGLAVKVDGRTATPCGPGCYRVPAGSTATTTLEVEGARLVLRAPPAAPGAAALLARIARTFRARRTLAFSERLATGSGSTQLTRFEVAAPHRLRYSVAGGAQAIVVGARRWDRTSASAPWIESPQTPLAVTQPPWRSPTNVHLVAPDTLTFLDRSIPAWFELHLGPGNAPRRLDETAASHFAVDSYSSFDGSVAISPPASSR